MEKMQFTYRSYERLMSLLKHYGYGLKLYGEDSEEAYSCILRHDVDMDLEKALKMAQLEAQLDVRSTYFILVSSDLYNISSKRSSELLQEIVRCGHSIGLHYDEKRYLDGIKEEFVRQEISVLEKSAGCKVSALSMHRPSLETLNHEYQFEGLENSYSDKYFREIKYVSDSHMTWRENIFDIVCGRNFRSLQILTHPIWYSEEEERLEYKLKSFINRASEERYNQIEENFSGLREILPIENIKRCGK